MRYMGSKSRLAKKIIPIMLNNYKTGQTFYDLFSGGCNLTDKIVDDVDNVVANDNNIYLIEMYKALQNGWQPPEVVSENEYYHIKDNIDAYSKCLVGFVGFGCSFGGMWFSSYAKGGFNGDIPRMYSRESRNNVLKQAEKLKNVSFNCGSYDEVTLQPSSILYCDIPYKNTVKYKQNQEQFNYDKFYQWCIEKNKQGHKVFISEYSMPDMFTCVFKQEQSITLGQNSKDSKRIEKLFTLK